MFYHFIALIYIANFIVLAPVRRINAKVGSGAAEEQAPSADRSHPPCALSRN
jgi:hypothetical protein